MYTEDDKYSKQKHNQNKSKSNDNVNYNNDNYDDFYKDFRDETINTDIDYSFDYDVENYNPKRSKGKINKLDTSYSENYNDNALYKYNKNFLDNKKYNVLIIILVIVLVVLICVLVRTINVKKPPVGNNRNYVRLQYNQLDLKIGDSRKLELVLSDTKSNYKIEWFSNDDNVVTVDNNGNIRAVNKGEAIILVAYYLNDKIYDTQCYINVLN